MGKKKVVIKNCLRCPFYEFDNICTKSDMVLPRATELWDNALIITPPTWCELRIVKEIVLFYVED